MMERQNYKECGAVRFDSTTWRERRPSVARSSAWRVSIEHRLDSAITVRSSSLDDASRSELNLIARRIVVASTLSSARPTDARVVATAGLGCLVSVFFFQAEDGIRDDLVTGVQTCALPI